MAESKANGLVQRALDLLKRRRPPNKRIGFDASETRLLRRAGRRLLEEMTDEELNAELERRERQRLVDYGLAHRRNRKPKRPENPFDSKIRESKQLEKERKPLMLEKRRAYFEARDELKQASRRGDPDRLDAARRRAQDAEFEWRRAEQDWRRCRRGRRALKLARSRYLAEKEYTAGLRRTGRL